MPSLPVWHLNGQFTIVFSWNRTVRTGAGFPNALGTGSGAAGDNGWLIYSTTAMSYKRNNVLLSISAVSDGIWYQAGLVYDGASAAYVLNGTVGTFAAKDWPALTTVRQLWLGWAGTGDRDTARLGYVRIWSRALSSAEVAALYNEPYGGDLYLVPGPRVWAIGAAGLPLVGDGALVGAGGLAS
jgi:hypothetical protein